MDESFVDELNAELSVPQAAMSVEAPKKSKAKGFLSHYFKPQKEQKERTVAGKTFRLRRNVWIDTEHAEKATLIRIQRDSDAYRALLKAIPQLKVYFDAEERILVTIGRYSIEIAPDGKASLSQEEIQRVVDSWNAFQGAV